MNVAPHAPELLGYHQTADTEITELADQLARNRIRLVPLRHHIHWCDLIDETAQAVAQHGNMFRFLEIHATALSELIYLCRNIKSGDFTMDCCAVCGHKKGGPKSALS